MINSICVIQTLSTQPYIKVRTMRTMRTGIYEYALRIGCNLLNNK